MTVPNQWPIPLDTTGSCTLWTDPSLNYKFQVYNAGNALQYTLDNVLGSGQSPTLQQSHVDTLSGTGAQTTFTLSASPASTKDTNVYISGIYQEKSTYNVSGTLLTFNTAPASGTNNIEVTYYVLLDFTGLAATIAGYSAVASASASDAQTSALAASTSETNAATSASNAATSETNAASSATASAASAVAAAGNTPDGRGVSVADYPSLRAYAGTATAIQVLNTGIGGPFVYDSADTTSADNGGTIIVASNGKRWKRVYAGPANVKWFGVTGDGVTDDTAAMKVAIAAARNLYLPPGTYLTNFGDVSANPTYITNIPSGTTFTGAGDATVWKPYTVTARGCIGTDSGSSSVQSEDITFRNIRFEGTVVANGLLQTAHLLYLSGVKRVRVEKCMFYGMRGDGFYLGSGFGAGAGNERHNYDVNVTDCYFDGVNNHNRNGISVIDVDGLVVDGCTFTRLADPTMPGSIDFEPDDSYSVIKNIFVTNNKFDQCTGSGGHINVAVGSIAYTSFQNLIVQGNHFKGNNGVVVNTNNATPGSTPTQANAVVVNGNTFTATQWPLYKGTGSLWGLEFSDNQVYTSFSSGGFLQIGHPTLGAANWRTRGLVIADNRITGNNAYIIACNESIQYGTIDNNILDGATSAAVLMGLSGATSTNVSITNNKVLGTPTYTVDHQSTTKNASGNVYRNNTAASTVTHTFQAYNSDNCGATSNVFDQTILPNAFPYGVNSTQVTNKQIVSGTAVDVGMMRTERMSSVGETNTIQWFTPQYDATFGPRLYFRKATAATTWDAWKLLTGT